MKKYVVDKMYSKVNLETGEMKPLKHVVHEKSGSYFMAYSEFAPVMLTLDGREYKLLMICGWYSSYCSNEVVNNEIIVNDRFVKYVNEIGLSISRKNISNIMSSLVTKGALFRVERGRYALHPALLFKGKTKIRNKIIRNVNEEE